MKCISLSSDIFQLSDKAQGGENLTEWAAGGELRGLMDDSCANHSGLQRESAYIGRRGAGVSNEYSISG